MGQSHLDFLFFVGKSGSAVSEAVFEVRLGAQTYNPLGFRGRCVGCRVERSDIKPCLVTSGLTGEEDAGVPCHEGQEVRPGIQCRLRDNDWWDEITLIVFLSHPP